MYSYAMRELHIERLSDEFGQYEILLRCACGHERRCKPAVLARIAGWDARFEAIVARMRCSKCGKRRCRARVVALAAGSAGQGNRDGSRRDSGVP